MEQALEHPQTILVETSEETFIGVYTKILVKERTLRKKIEEFRQQNLIHASREVAKQADELTHWLDTAEQYLPHWYETGYMDE